MSGDVIQPSYRGNLVDVIQSTIKGHISNIKNLSKHVESVDVKILLNYKTKLINNLDEIIFSYFDKENIPCNINTITFYELKNEFFNKINFFQDLEIRTNYFKYFGQYDSLWIQPYQFLKLAYSNLESNYFIKSRLDSFIFNDALFTDLYFRFDYAYNFKGNFLKTLPNGYCIVDHLFLNSSRIGIDVADVIFGFNKSAVIKCFNNFSCLFRTSSYNQQIRFYCEEIFGLMLLRNKILTFPLYGNNSFVYRDFMGDPHKIKTLKDLNF